MVKVRHKLYAAFIERRLPSPGTPEEIDELIVSYKEGSQDAEEKLVHLYLRLVVKLVSKYGDDDEFLSAALEQLLISLRDYRGREDGGKLTNFLYTRINYRLIAEKRTQSLIKFSHTTFHAGGGIFPVSLSIKEADKIIAPSNIAEVDFDDWLQSFCESENDYTMLTMYLQGYTRQDTATRLRLAKRTVCLRLNMLLTYIRRSWDDCDKNFV
jgi:DNA-directed RNA polymerase specialized sigma24 family protein